MHEKSACVFAHTSIFLTDVKKQTRGHVLEHNIDQLSYDFPVVLEDHTQRSPVENFYNFVVIESLKNRYLLLDRLYVVLISVQKLIFDDFDCDFGFLVIE